MKRRTFLIGLGLLCAAAASPAAAARGEGFVSDRISMSVTGEGPDVVLIPGMGSSPEVWEGTTENVPGYRYHVVQVHGFAGAPLGGNAGEGPVVDAIAEEIARYISDARLRRPAVIGHSMGGTLGMTVAAKHPDLVSKLMVVDMLPYLGMLFAPPGSTQETVQEVADQNAARIAATGREERRRTTEASMATMVRNESKRARQVELSLTSDLGLNARVMRDLIATDLRPALAKFKGALRVLYVRGPNIPMTDAQMDAVYELQFSGNAQATLRRVPEAYHFIMFDQAALFADEVRAFLKP